MTIEVRTQLSGPPVPGRPEGCKAETWFSVYQGPCFVCPCGADSLAECKRECPAIGGSE